MANEIMKSFNYGVEIEFTGITRAAAAEAVASVLGSTSGYFGGAYKEFHATDRKARVWKVCRDASIHASDDYKCELVTPILQYEDIETLQEIIRALRKRGAITNNSCGIHVHVGAENFTPANLRNLANIFYSKEDLIYKAIECDSNHRDMYYCQKTNRNFIERLNSLNSLSTQTIKVAWYGDNYDHSAHYDNSRYHGLNLHAYYTKKTVEFRCFNSTLHAGKVKAYIQLCLGICQQAMQKSHTIARKRTYENDLKAFRRFLRRIGLVGEEFKTAKQHLLKNLKPTAGEIAA